MQFFSCFRLVRREISLRILLRDRHAPADAEGATRDFDTGRGLGAFVFVQVDPAQNPAHGFFVEAARDDLMCALVFLNVELQDFVEQVVGRERILVDLAGL